LAVGGGRFQTINVNIMELVDESKKVFGSKADQNQFNETEEILKQSFRLWKEFFQSLRDARNLSRLERVSRGQISRLLELHAAGGAK